MIKILKYSFYDLIRSKWSYIYFAFYLSLGFSLLFLSDDLAKSIITLMNIIVVLTPLIGTIFGAMYYYNSKEFIELLLAQPLKRNTIFLGQYLGLSISLSFSLLAGLGIPFLFYGILMSHAIFDFFVVLIVGAVLTFIFTAISYNIALVNDDKIKGFGYALLSWLFMAIIYDGIFLISLMVFDEYPLEYLAIVGSMFNPIDLSRILIILNLDISALLGYTGAVLQKFLGTSTGMISSSFLLMLWIFIPIKWFLYKSKRKDF